jgi:hydroxyacylglutathione hydrolase
MNSHQNVYWTQNRISNWFVIKGNRTILIDTGAPAALAKMLWYFRREKIQLDSILLTHGHADHAGNIKKLNELYGCEVVCHPLELDYLQGKVQRPKRDYTGINPFGRVIQFGDKLFGDPVFPETLSFDETPHLHADYHFYPCPGHTKGSAIIKHKPSQSIFLGDAIHTERAIYLNRKAEIVYPYPYFCEDHQQAINSLQILNDIDFKHAFFGHGKPIFGNAKKILCDFINRGKSASQAIYASERDSCKEVGSI